MRGHIVPKWIETSGNWGAGKRRRRAGWRVPSLAVFHAMVSLVGLSAASLAGPVVPHFEPHASAVVEIAVFGRDDRIQSPKDRSAVADKIGVLVDLDRKTVCTAFCVGTATVMTAAHCLYPAEGPSGARLDAIRFRKSLQSAGSDARIAGAGHRTAADNVLVGSTKLNLRPPIDAVSDWTLIRLDRNVCPAGGLTISRRSTQDVLDLARDKRVYNIAFHRDFENFTRALGAPCDAPRSFDGATWDTIRSDFRKADDLILHTCDTGGSSSGSPLLFDGPDGPEVVGINVGTYLHSTVATPARERQSVSGAASSSRDIANTAIAGHTVADAVAAFADAELLVARSSIRELQSRLAATGDYAGPLDGSRTPRLAAAIKRLQFRAGLPITGLPTRRLLRDLE